MTLKRGFASLATFLVIFATWGRAQSEKKAMAGGGPGGVAQMTFSAHRLGTDHAEGVTTLDVNGDGFADIVSGAYWYENPGANGGEWKPGRICFRLRRVDH